jgi:hypothetical protein
MRVSAHHRERPPAAEYLQGNKIMMKGIMPCRPGVAAIMHPEIYDARAPDRTLKRRLDCAAR